jgi:hypothetical protein
MPGDGYERNPTSPSKTLRAKMGCPFQPTGTVNAPKNVGAKAAPAAPTVRRGAAKAKENPAATGIEVGFARNWSFALEYDQTKFDIDEA